MKINPKVSIIVPCYNQGKFINECLESILQSSFLDYEVIIVNDGSTDEMTNKILAESAWEKTTIYSISNNGVAYARNFGILKSTGDYILPIDADDKISTNFIYEAVSILDSDSDVKVVCSEVELFGIRKGRMNLPEFSIENLIASNTMVVSSMFRRFDFDKTKGFNNEMIDGFEDWDFWLSLLGTGGKVSKLNFIGFYYRIKRGSRNSSLNEDKYLMLRKKLIENHPDLYKNNVLYPTKSFEYFLILNSIEYRIGKLIVKPLRRIMGLIK